MCYLVAKDTEKRGCYALKTSHGKRLVNLKRTLDKEVGVKGIQLVTISCQGRTGVQGLGSSHACLTHTVTHTAKQSNGNNGHKSAGKDSPTDRKGHKRLGKQETSSSQSVGKDEVPSSNLGSSSRNPRKPRFSGIFCCKK